MQEGLECMSGREQGSLFWLRQPGRSEEMPRELPADAGSGIRTEKAHRLRWQAGHDFPEGDFSGKVSPV